MTLLKKIFILTYKFLCNKIYVKFFKILNDYLKEGGHRMDKEEKGNKMFLYIAIVAIIIIVIAAVVMVNARKDEESQPKQIDEFVSESSDGTRTNTSSKLHEEKIFEGIKISEIEMTQVSDNATSLAATITNVSDTVQGNYTLYLKVLNKSEEELVKIPISVPELQPGMSTTTSATASYNVINAYDISLEKAQQ